MMKNVIEIIGNSEQSELDVMTFHVVIRVANEHTRENLYIPVSLLESTQLKSWAYQSQHLNSWRTSWV